MKELAFITLILLGLTLIVGIVTIAYVLVDTIVESMYNKSMRSLAACLSFIECILIAMLIGITKAAYIVFLV